MNYIILADANPSNPQHFLTERGQKTHDELLSKYPQGSVEYYRLVWGEWVDDDDIGRLTGKELQATAKTLDTLKKHPKLIQNLKKG